MAYAHKSGIILHIFQNFSDKNFNFPFNFPNFKELRPKTTKIAWRGPTLNQNDGYVCRSMYIRAWQAWRHTADTRTHAGTETFDSATLHQRLYHLPSFC